jgi:hypothetical protein
VCIFLAYCFCRGTNKESLSNGSSTNQIGSITKLRMSNGSGSTVAGMKAPNKNQRPTNGKTNASSKSSITSSNHNGEFNPFLQQKIQQTNDAYGYVPPPYMQQQQVFYQQQPPQQVPLMQQYHHQQQQMVAKQQATLGSQADCGVKQYTSNNIRLLQEIGKGNRCV